MGLIELLGIKDSDDLKVEMFTKSKKRIMYKHNLNCPQYHIYKFLIDCNYELTSERILIKK